MAPYSPCKAVQAGQVLHALAIHKHREAPLQQRPEMSGDKRAFQNCQQRLARGGIQIGATPLVLLRYPYLKGFDRYFAYKDIAGANDTNTPNLPQS